MVSVKFKKLAATYPIDLHMVTLRGSYAQKLSDVYFSNTVGGMQGKILLYHCNPLNEIFLKNTLIFKTRG